MREDSEAPERAHSETPAEGDATAEPFDDRAHSQDAAEGPDIDDEPGPGAKGNAAPGGRTGP
ncbi:hypothetical protein [Arthrobacter sp. ES3-54]|uniref:hypothetical protein n=1 Tax=Arthrobacter sp. ES3-54 TaxID=1502991 RepID=UPI0024057B3F|nr:hypothetical protein [Arthrobacter sp. ES3-54]MDF9752833.1 hypothetical protein [Arthrobacter sp. ES3-54]